MRKLISVLLASAMVLSMASCTSKTPSGHRDIDVVDGTMFFISPLASFGGAEWYYRMYDVNGTNLEYDEGWVGSPY